MTIIDAMQITLRLCTFAAMILAFVATWRAEYPTATTALAIAILARLEIAI